MMSRTRILRSPAAKRALRSPNYEWAHVLWGPQIPPVAYGSMNYLVWELIQRRNPHDLLLSQFDPEAFKLAEASDCHVVAIDAPRQRSLLAKVSARALASLGVQGDRSSPLVNATAELIRRTQVENVLVWGGMKRIRELRRLLPDHRIAFAQRHYDYPTQWSYYDDCDLLIAQTRGQVRLAFERMRRLTPEVVVIPNGAELDVFRPPSPDERRAARHRLELPEDAFVAIFPSKLALYKGTRYLLSWIRSSALQARHVFFLVVGYAHKSLPARHERELRAGLSDQPNVRWVTGARRAEMPGYYHAADVCLMPGVWREGFSMAATEALAAGLPLIASRAGCYEEIVADGVNGVLCRQEYLERDGLEALLELSADATRVRRMARNARCYAEARLSRERTLQNFIALLENRLGDIEGNLGFPEDLLK